MEGELIDSTESRDNITFEGQRLKNYHIISKDLLLQLSKKLQESLTISSSSCPQIDHRFDNVVHYNCRKFYIINHWLESPPGMERGRCERPVYGAIFYENWYSTDFYEKVIAWLEGNLLRGPSPQLRGPFDPNTWQDSSFEEDAKPFLGPWRFAEFRRLRDSIREYIDLSEPTDEQTDQILEYWTDVFWRYPLRNIPVILTMNYWVERRPTEDELRRLKGHWQDIFNDAKGYWAMR